MIHDALPRLTRCWLPAMPTTATTNAITPIHRQWWKSYQEANSHGSSRGSSRMHATVMITVHCTSSALRSQTVNIDQVSALKNPTWGER